jgi:hypothetical protein
MVKRPPKRCDVWRPQSPYGRMWRGFVGCAIAYGMALQLIPSGLVVVSSITLLSAAHSAEHCVTSSGDDASVLPSNHHPTCRCGPGRAMLACATIVGGLQAKATIAWRTTAASTWAGHLDPRASLPRAMAGRAAQPRAPQWPNPLIV